MSNETSSTKIAGVRYSVAQVKALSKDQFIEQNLKSRMQFKSMSEADARKTLAEVWEQCQPKTEAAPSNPTPLTKAELQDNVSKAEKALSAAVKTNAGPKANDDTAKAVQTATEQLAMAKSALDSFKE